MRSPQFLFLLMGLSFAFQPAIALEGVLDLQDIDGTFRRSDFSSLRGVPISAAAAGDLNGDGYADVVIGSPGSLANGAVLISYGSPLHPSQRFSHLDGSFGTGTPKFGDTILHGDDAGDSFGTAVAVGDFNGDGRDDLLVGVPQADLGSHPDAGEVYIIYGGTFEEATLVQLNAASGMPSPLGETRILGFQTFGRLGATVSAADINNDGFDDAILASANGSTSNGRASGKVLIVFGNAGLPGTIVDLDSTDDAITSAGETRILGDDADDELGRSIAVGDVDGDGLPDLIIGAPGGRDDAGEVFIVYNSSLAPGSRISLNSEPPDAPTGHGETRLLGGTAGGALGGAIAAGDIGGDGRADLILGSPAENQAIIIDGTALAPSTTIEFTADGTISALGEFRIEGTGPDDLFGASVLLADGNGDGLDDVLAGAPDGAILGRPHPGYVAFLSANSIDFGTTATAQSSADWLLAGAFRHLQLGWGLTSLGDVDRDGVADFFTHGSYFNGIENIEEGLVLYGRAPSTGHSSATRISPQGSGRIPAADFGGAVRATLKFADGDGATPSRTTIERTHAATAERGSLENASVAWMVDSDRTGWTSATLTLRYLDREVAALDKAQLTVRHSHSPGGPWTEIVPRSHDLLLNTITLDVDSLGLFTISAPPARIRVDGSADAAYGPPIAVQTGNTGFGDANGSLFPAGSELDALYVTNDGERLYLLIAGNLEGNANVISFWTDSTAAVTGRSVAPQMTGQVDSWFQYGRFEGSTLPTGFDVEYGGGFKFFDSGASGLGTMDYTFHEWDFRLPREFAARDFYTTTTLNPLADYQASDISVALDNSNSAGVTADGVNGALLHGTDPGLVSTGLEFSIPLSRIAPELGPGSEIKLWIALSNGTMDYFSNQFLPPIHPPAQNVGSTPVNFPLVATTPVTYRLRGGDHAGSLHVAMTSGEFSPTSNLPIPVRATFGRPVLGFTAEDITASGAIVTSFRGSGADYFFDLLPLPSAEAVELRIPAGAAVDLDGTPNQPSPIFLRRIEAPAEPAAAWIIR